MFWVLTKPKCVPQINLADLSSDLSFEVNSSRSRRVGLSATVVFGFGFTEDYDVRGRRFMCLGVSVYMRVPGEALLHLVPSVSGGMRACKLFELHGCVEERGVITPGVLFHCSVRYQLCLMGLWE